MSAYLHMSPKTGFFTRTILYTRVKCTTTKSHCALEDVGRSVVRTCRRSDRGADVTFEFESYWEIL